MKLRLVKVGRFAHPETKALADVYLERLSAYVKVEIVEAKDAEKALEKAKDSLLILLDERGEQWSSKELAAELQKLQDDPAVKTVTFVVGGPMGVGEEIRAKAKRKWCLSKGTLTSDISWLVCCEQIYRAWSILKNSPYHHE